MKTSSPAPATLPDDWKDWIGPALKKFGSAGYGEVARTMTVEALRELLVSPDLLFSSAITDPSGARGLALVTHARWEEGVLSKPVAKVAFFAADSFELAKELAGQSLRAGHRAGVVLISYPAGHCPTYIHGALWEAGFHVGSQQLTVRADLNAIAPAVAKVPLRGKFRPATPADANAVAAIGRTGLVNARYTADPYFPAAWGGEIYAAWGRDLVLGAADIVIVAEQNERVIGFVSMCMDVARRAKAPDLMAVDPKYDGLGTGVMLIRHMLDYYREHGMKIMTGTTEKNNTPINALYARLGVTFIDSNIMYHASPALSPLKERLSAG